MKPTAERYQAATRVNAISPEIVLIEEADSLKATGRQYGYTHKWREYDHSSGVVGSGMVLNGLYRNLGDPDRFPLGISANKLRKRGCGDASQGVRQLHSTLSMGKPCTWGRELHYCVEF